jgi:hypothetical protein
LKEASLQWRAENHGMDGVVIERVENGVIRGAGEWDRPGGWRPFTISLRSGRSMPE